MRIKWLVDTFATVDIKGKPTALLLDHEYEIEEDSEYFQAALTRGWFEVLPDKKAPAANKTKEAE
jgi:hypothetical protein